MTRFFPFWASLRVEIRGTGPERILPLLLSAGIAFRDPVRMDREALLLSLSPRGFRRMRGVLRGKGLRVRICAREGLSFRLSPLLRRWGLWTGAAGAVFLLVFLSSFVWTVEVTGVDRATAEKIEAFLASEGLYPGALLRTQDPVELKSRLLIALDELDFAAVNLLGSRAKIEARASFPPPDAGLRTASLPADLVAGKSGVLLDLRIHEGETVLSPGVAVEPGDVIASHEVHGVIPGTKELSGAVRFVHARGEAYARIEGKLTALMPRTRLVKRYTGREYRENLLFFAEMPIIFLKPYGIPHARCDKIRNGVDLSLPAGRLLPLRRIRTRFLPYLTEPREVSRDEAYRELSSLMERTLLGEAKDGRLEELSARIRGEGEVWRLDADYIITEDIGEERILSPLP